MARQIATCGLQLRLFDMTSDIAVPCYATTLADAGILNARQPRYHDVTIGHGAHPVARRAAIRAVTEAAQSRLTYISGARDDVPCQAPCASARRTRVTPPESLSHPSSSASAAARPLRVS